jgi:hypothetical protein
MTVRASGSREARSRCRRRLSHNAVYVVLSGCPISPEGFVSASKAPRRARARQAVGPACAGENAHEGAPGAKTVPKPDLADVHGS